jgi:hypothetical protein
MSEAMVNALARLYAEGMRRHGWANNITNSPGQRGFIFHRAFMNTQCPCQVRLDRRGEILRRATGGAPAPGPTPPPSEELTVAQIDQILKRLDDIEATVRNHNGMAAVRGSNNVVWGVGGAGRFVIHPRGAGQLNAADFVRRLRMFGLIGPNSEAAPKVEDGWIDGFPPIGQQPPVK